MTTLKGTVQFMALELLTAFVKQQSGRASQIAFEQKPSHDIQSIVLVLVYTLLRRLRSIAMSNVAYKNEAAMLNDAFKDAFGRNTVKFIRNVRQCAALFRWSFDPDLKSFVKEHLSQHLYNVLINIYRRIIIIYVGKALDEVADFPMNPNSEYLELGDMRKDFTYDELIEFLRPLA